MPKKTASPKKARWTTARKAQARAQRSDTASGTQPGGGADRPRTGRSGRPRVADGGAPRYPRRDAAPERDRNHPRTGAGDDRREHRGGPRRDERGFEPRRDDRGDDRRDGRGYAPRRDDRRDERGYAPRRDDRGDGRRDDRGYAPRRDDRGDGRRDGRGYAPRRDDRRDERGYAPRRDDRGDDRRDGRGYAPRRDDRRDERGYAPRRDDRGDGRRDDRGYAPRRDDRRRDDRPTRERFPRERDERGVRASSGRVADPARRDRHEGRHAHDDAESWTTYTARASKAVEVDADNGFSALGLPPELVSTLAAAGIADPFPIQAATIPDALAGRDVLGRGRTGSGKTLAFGLPMITRLKDGGRAKPNRPRAIILVPTRELAMQVLDALDPFVRVAGLSQRLIAGGMTYDPQLKALSRGVDILVATPGRLNDLIERGAADLSEVEVVVIDEADHLADLGFLPEVTTILDAAPAGGQRLMFSATLDGDIDKLVERYLVDPVTHSTDDAQAAVTTMSHHVLLIAPQDKKAITARLAGRGGRVVIFARTQLGAERIASELRGSGVVAAALHGGLSQGVRNRVLGAFRTGTVPVLVATDVAARGIHVDDVALVLQVDPPKDHKDYLHRAGRTARAGEEGHVVMFALPHQKAMVTRLIEKAGAQAQVETVRPGDAALAALGAREPDGSIVTEAEFRSLVEPAQRPRRRPSGGRSGQGGYGGSRGYRGNRRGRD